MRRMLREDFAASQMEKWRLGDCRTLAKKGTFEGEVKRRPEVFRPPFLAGVELLGVSWAQIRLVGRLAFSCEISAGLVVAVETELADHAIEIAGE